MILWVAEANGIRGELQPEVQESLRRHEEAGTTDSPEYEHWTMVFYARHGEAMPFNAGTIRDGILGAEWVIFEESSHTGHAQAVERYMQFLVGFLARIEARDSTGS
jgi:hypothetical protein